MSKSVLLRLVLFVAAGALLPSFAYAHAGAEEAGGSIFGDAATRKKAVWSILSEQASRCAGRIWQ